MLRARNAWRCNRSYKPRNYGGPSKHQRMLYWRVSWPRRRDAQVGNIHTRAGAQTQHAPTHRNHNYLPRVRAITNRTRQGLSSLGRHLLARNGVCKTFSFPRPRIESWPQSHTRIIPLMARPTRMGSFAQDRIWCAIQTRAKASWPNVPKSRPVLIE